MTSEQGVAGDVDAAAVVSEFLAALAAGELDRVDALLADDLIYQNVGFPTVRGRRRTVATFRAMRGRVDFDVVVHRAAASGATVMNERTDSFGVGRFRVHIWVCGVFTVVDGKIALWRDYFDVADAFKGVIRGLVAIVVPSLQRRVVPWGERDLPSGLPDRAAL